MSSEGSVGGERERFALAPMGRSIRWLTGALLAIPLLLVVAGLAAPEVRFLVALGALVAALYAGVFALWRPSAFEVTPASLVLHFPTRRLEVPAHEVVSARPIDAAAFRAEYGFAVRVGAGGLFGGFGWLWTRRGGWVEFYVSRVDGAVLVERRGREPLLITPERPEAFVAALRAASAGGGR